MQRFYDMISQRKHRWLVISKFILLQAIIHLFLVVGNRYESNAETEGDASQLLPIFSSHPHCKCV
ncbi:unnamed protein product [Musa hybrid cultivar]